MHAQPVVRHTASDPGARSRFGVWKIVAIALAVVILIILAVEVFIRTQSTINFRGNTYTVDKTHSSCSGLPGDQRLTTIGSTLGHPINGPSSVDRPAVIYLRCFPTGYIAYQTAGT